VRKKSPSYKRVLFLRVVDDRFISGIKLNSFDGIPTISYQQYAASPHAVENELLDELSPPRSEKRKRDTFYSKLRESQNAANEITPTDPDDMRISRMLKHVLDNRSAKKRYENIQCT
jgi:hypothetical protein